MKLRICPSYIDKLASDFREMRMPSIAEDLSSCSNQIRAFATENQTNIKTLESIHADLVNYNVKLPAKTYFALNRLIAGMRK